jgi:hypothetical protein
MIRTLTNFFLLSIGKILTCINEPLWNQFRICLLGSQRVVRHDHCVLI